MSYRDDINAILQAEDFEQAVKFYRTMREQHKAAMQVWQDSELAWDVVLRVFGLGRYANREYRPPAPPDDMMEPEDA